MTNKEREKMLKDLSKMIDDQLKQQIQRQVFMNANFGMSNPTTVSWQPHSASSPYPKISPTGCDAKGMFSYQEPEQDEQGTYYGYKVLIACTCGCGRLISPRFTVDWGDDGSLKADREPSERSMFGIHFTKRPDNPCLGEYTHSYTLRGEPVLVQCALSGTIVETEQGFRAEYAQIIGVYDDGHWQSYQDYKERSAANPSRNPWEENYWQANYDPYGTAFAWNTGTNSKKGKGGKRSP